MISQGPILQFSTLECPGTEIANFWKFRDQTCNFFRLFTQGPNFKTCEFLRTFVDLSSKSNAYGPFLSISKLEGPFLPIFANFCSKDYSWHFVIPQGVFWQSELKSGNLLPRLWLLTRFPNSCSFLSFLAWFLPISEISVPARSQTQKHNIFGIYG